MILNYFFKQISRALAVLLILNTNIMANEQPDYTVIKKDNEFEIRQYTNFLTVTVETEGERDDAIGKGVVETLTGHRSTAVLMKNHGVFTIGKNATAAVKSAVMCEDVAKTTWIAKTMGTLQIISPADIDKLFDRYQNVYGQPGSAK